MKNKPIRQITISNVWLILKRKETEFFLVAKINWMLLAYSLQQIDGSQLPSNAFVCKQSQNQIISISNLELVFEFFPLARHERERERSVRQCSYPKQFTHNFNFPFHSCLTRSVRCMHSSAVLKFLFLSKTQKSIID